MRSLIKNPGIKGTITIFFLAQIVQTLDLNPAWLNLNPNKPMVSI